LLSLDQQKHEIVRAIGRVEVWKSCDALVSRRNPMYPKQCKSAYTRNSCPAMLIATPFTIYLQLRCPTLGEWMKKMWYITQWSNFNP
jgi:hypothetical protein